ncbi:hypothetical protein [Kribbella sp. HUAS MG21]|uniref:Transposase n=1 Tax=Kribbella sp. HUAS MG21 TaxID=3160966 RepID=A0AAU7TLQ0_9ACTN
MQLDPALELYGLSPEQFTAARNQLAKTLRDAGDTRGSDTIRALRKPTIAAWLANRLVRTVPDQIAELTDFGEDLREAHRLGDRARLKMLTARRHELVNRLVDVARADAAGDGRSMTMSSAERLAATLDAALVDPGAAQMLRSGRLTSGLRHVGFGVVDETGTPIPVTDQVRGRPTPTATAAKAAPRKASPTKKAAGPRTRRLTQDEQLRRQRAELQERLREVEADYEAAENERAAAESELDANEHHIADMQTAIERLTDELEHARRELRHAQSRTRKLERALTRAARLAAASRRRRDAQQQRLEAFNG